MHYFYEPLSDNVCNNNKAVNFYFNFIMDVINIDTIKPNKVFSCNLLDFIYANVFWAVIFISKRMPMEIFIFMDHDEGYYGKLLGLIRRNVELMV